MKSAAVNGVSSWHEAFESTNTLKTLLATADMCVPLGEQLEANLKLCFQVVS